MIEVSASSTRRWIWIAALAAPLAVVQVVRIFAGDGPQAAPAASTPDAPEAAPVAAATPVISEAQRRAMAALKNYQPAEGFDSPLDRPDPAPPATVEPEPAPAPIADEPDPLQGVSVTAILGQGQDAAAIIGHKLRRVGDEVAPGWWVQAIDPRLRTVELASDRGRTVVLTPPSK